MRLAPKRYVKYRHQEAYVTSDGNLFLKRNRDTDKFEIRKYTDGVYEVLKRGYSRKRMLKKLLKTNIKLKQRGEV